MGEKQYLIMLDMDVRKRHYHIAEAGKITNFTVQLEINVDPNVAKAGGLQSQGVKGDVVVGYRESLTTQDLKFSSFPDGPLARGPKGQQHGKIYPNFRIHHGRYPESGAFTIILCIITDH